VGQDHPHAFQFLLEHCLLLRFLAPSPHHHAQALLLALPDRQARLPSPPGAVRGPLHGMSRQLFWVLFLCVWHAALERGEWGDSCHDSFPHIHTLSYRKHSKRWTPSSSSAPRPPPPEETA
jgi:hypothetical protein